MGNKNIYRIVEEVSKGLYIRALKIMPADVQQALRQAYSAETSRLGRKNLAIMLENIRLAEKEDNLLCQDTGLPLYFVSLGTKLDIDIPELKCSIARGCARATKEYPLRSNTLHPVTRERTFTNTGKGIPVLHFDFVPESDSIDITMVPKGSGSENMSFLRMFTPAQGIAAVKRFIISSTIEAGANPCPPTIVGIGLGGTAELCMLLAKKAIARPIGRRNEDKVIARLEIELLEAINQLGLGPMGLGGDATALAIHIEHADTHITLNPVAINFQCWAARRASARISQDGEVRELVED